MNRFARLTAGTRTQIGKWSILVDRRRHPQRQVKNGPLPDSRRRHALLSIAVATAVLAAHALPVAAQRVQFPTSTQPANPYAVPPPAGTYPTTPYGASPYTVTPAPTTPYSPAAVGPPPLFDPYASGSVSPPPPAVPYTPSPAGAYPPPPPASAFPQQPVPLYPNSPPVQWQPAPYDIATSGEGYWDKTQRFFQELSGEYTYLYGDHTDPDDFEVNRFELSSTFAFPLFYNTQTPLLVTPGFAFNWLEGPITSDPPLVGEPDLPSQVYDAYLDLAWYPRWNQWLGAELGVRTGVYSDFHHVSSDSIRLMGRGLASVAITPNLDILFGAVYLDRLDVKLLPAGGFYYRPTPEWDMYLVFPNPKVRRFMTAIGNSKWYWYAAGEYGGGNWTARRANGDDRFDYNDIRVIGGLEWETQTFIRGHLEVGYVWDREIIFNSAAPPNFRPDDTIMLRAGIDF